MDKDIKTSKESLDRDTQILKVIGGNMDNLGLLKDIVFKLMKRVEKLEDRVNYLDLLTVATDKLKEKND
tara:strand:- start:179 stop:385 length:207 start_codon:yes stop_codon:yes gene_type:complete